MPYHLDIVLALGMVFPPDNRDDDSRRSLTYKVAQTLKSRFPSEGEWGCKREGDGPQSADLLMLRGQNIGYDIMTGTAGQPEVRFIWEERQLTVNAVFIPVPAYDWLAPIPHNDAPHSDTPHSDVPSEPQQPDLDVVIERIAEAVAKKVIANVTFPDYTGAIRIPFIGTANVTLTPKK